MLFVAPQLEQGKVYRVCLKTLDPETGDIVSKSFKHSLTADIIPDPEIPEPADFEEVEDPGITPEEDIPVAEIRQQGEEVNLDDVAESDEAQVDTGQADSEADLDDDPDDDVDETPEGDDSE